MSRTRFSVCSGLVFFCVFLLLNSTRPLHAQAPVAGTSVAVKMIDAVDSGSDPAGKQYRASLANAVDGGNGVRIPQGADAIVTLARNGSSWTTQLVSLTINGQSVAVASAPASVNAASGAANAVSSALHQLGHHVNAPPSVTAVATGQRVVLPPGTSLTFVLSQPPTPNAAAPAAPAPSPAQPAAPATASAPNAAPTAATTPTAGSGGPLTAMYICFSNPPPAPSDPNHKTEYLTAAFEVPVNTQGSIPALEPTFSEYLKAAYHYPSAGITCQPIWSVADAQTAQKKIISARDTAKLNMVNTGWRYGQPPVTQGQAGFDPLIAGPGGLDLTQHRLTTYMCTLDVAGGTTIVQPQPYDAQVATRYLSSLFQADWNSAPVSMAYNVFIRDRYVHDLNLSDLSPRCAAQSPAMLAMTHQTAMVGTKLIRHVVPVDFTDTPAEAAAGNAAQAATAQAAASAAPPAGGPFISCSTSGGAGIDTYLTGVFQTTHPVKHLPSGGNLVDQSVLDRFYAYLTQQGYKFKAGSNYGCDVSPTEAAAKAAQHKRAYEGGGCSTCGKIVETGWKDSQ